MVEINISVKTDSSTQLQGLLEHIVREITDTDYRLNEITRIRKVDEDWICLEEGKYQWSRNERS
jgi:hypothetical protein